MARTCVFVQAVPSDPSDGAEVAETSLRELCRPFGSVTYITRKVGKRGGHYAFVAFADADGPPRAIAGLDGRRVRHPSGWQGVLHVTWAGDHAAAAAGTVCDGDAEGAAFIDARVAGGVLPSEGGGERFEGVVRSFDEERRFGWIHCAALRNVPGGDVWVHRNNLRDVGAAVGQRVTFALHPGRDGAPMAVEVRSAMAGAAVAVADAALASVAVGADGVAGPVAASTAPPFPGAARSLRDLPVPPPPPLAELPVPPPPPLPLPLLLPLLR